MSSFNIQLPDINENSLNSAKERKAILEALYQVNEQLRYVLNNIGEENLSLDLRQKIESAGDNQAITQRVSDLEGDAYSFFEQTAETFALVVYKNGVIASINMSPEIVAIKANKIALEGYVSINGAFSVDESGNVRATGGTIGGWYIDSRYIMALSGVGAGSMMLDSATATISGGTIEGTVLRGNNIYGTTIYGSDGIYMGYDNGVIDVYAPHMTSSEIAAGRLRSYSGTLRLTNGTNTLTIGAGDVGGYPFMMDSSLGVGGVVDCTEVITGSDSRMKKDIADMTDEVAADLILNLRPVTFRYRTGDDRVHNGFVAQEVPEQMRRLGANGYFALAYNEIIAPLVKTVQQQEKRIAALEERLAKLEVG